MFMIDTGASATIILDRDVERFGLDWDALAHSDHQLGGIGGSVETRIIPDESLSFTATSGKTVREKLRIYVARHDFKTVSRRIRRSIMFIPSLLGRDVIEKYRFVYDKSRSQVYLEREAFEETVRRKQMLKAAESIKKLREESRTPGWSGGREIRKWRDTPSGLMFKPIPDMNDWARADAGKYTYEEMTRKLDRLRARWR